MTSVHPPYDMRIFRKECVSLAAAGYEVTLVVAAPCDEYRDGVRFVCVPPAVSRFQRMTSTVAKVFRAALSEDADIYHFHDPELISAGFLFKLLGKSVVYDVHEELPEDILQKRWLPAPARRSIAWVAYAVEHLSGQLFDGIVASRPALLTRFPASKTALVNNFPLLGELTPGSLPFKDRPHICAYVGVMTKDRGFLELVRALGHLPRSSKLEVHVAGDVEPEELIEQARKLPGWHRVQLLGWQPRVKVAELLAKARFGVVPFLPIPNHLRSYPTKLFEYMSAGLPTVASNIPLWQQTIQSSGVGWLADPEDPKEFASALQYAVDSPDVCEAFGKRGLRLIADEFNWNLESQRLLGLYRRILGIETRCAE